MGYLRSLTQSEAEQLLSDGVDWRVQWCWGAREPDLVGTGATVPAEVLASVPTAAMARRMRRGKALSRSFFYAILVSNEGEYSPDSILFTESPSEAPRWT